MKVVCWIACRFMDGTQPADNVGFCVGFIVSTGSYQSEINVNVDVTLNESQMSNAVKTAVATAVNTALGTSLNAADVRMM